VAPNDFWLFPKIHSALKGRKTLKKYDDGTEGYSATGVPKMFPTVAVQLG
jgi:hypothetical protein